jgi:recombinational DNA repair ATPase RecF
MIESISISGFKCFNSIKLKQLGRVNIVAGPNGSGKTALLEALFVATRGNPEALLQANAGRDFHIPQALIHGAVDPAPYLRATFDHFSDSPTASRSLRGRLSLPTTIAGPKITGLRSRTTKKVAQ